MKRGETMNELDKIASHLHDRPKMPPLHLWHPELSGDIDIEIKANGDWYHNGDLIRRKPLVKLFASILRREEDQQYYLVTPVEKWRIRVVDRPLMIIDMQLVNPGLVDQQIIFTNNVGGSYLLNGRYPLTVLTDAESGEPDPYLVVDNNLTAKINRAVYYQLVDVAIKDGDAYTVLSDTVNFVLG